MAKQLSSAELLALQMTAHAHSYMSVWCGMLAKDGSSLQQLSGLANGVLLLAAAQGLFPEQIEALYTSRVKAAEALARADCWPVSEATERCAA